MICFKREDLARNLDISVFVACEMIANMIIYYIYQHACIITNREKPADIRGKLYRSLP